MSGIQASRACSLESLLKRRFEHRLNLSLNVRRTHVDVADRLRPSRERLDDCLRSLLGDHPAFYRPGR